jgi:hypothetical protein
MAVRLIGVGQNASNVIAKRSQPAVAHVEQLVYEEILSNLPLPTVHYYGSTHQQGSRYSWLFLEDASRERYQPNNLEHRIAAAKWLGITHISTLQLGQLAQLPIRDSEHYLKILRRSRSKIQSFRSDPSFDSGEVQLFNAIEAHCEKLSRIWEQFRIICSGSPNTLVHGDFISKNVAVRTTEAGITILPFDWEKAGWGNPAEDISRVDIPSYWDIVQNAWSEVSIHTFIRLASVGKIFRCLVYMEWISSQLEKNTMEQPLYHLERCHTWLTDLINTLPWQN